ncbi:hypothetical protein KAU51_02770 [Candidatus Parcubacteria bacterium]|nr:hypothetical protein [Candidatus Parcubacteria bacterium]
MSNQNQFKFLNKGISTPIGILIIVLVAGIAGGIVVWQYGWLSEREGEMSKEKLPEEVIPEEESCSQDSDCVFLDFQCCPTPDPCKREPSKVVNKANKEKIEQEMKAKCPPLCPRYAPPRCFDCLNLEKFTPVCVDNRCTVKKEINCEEYCKAVAKDKSEPCPWISNERLLTEKNTEMCGCLE